MPTPAPARPAAAIALLAPSEPIPPPWCTDPTRPACDLCGYASEQLWTLACAPADDLPAGELLICRTCATAVRPPADPAAPPGRVRPRRRRRQLLPHATSGNGIPATLT